jgi:1-acyl-sn-glycerol-3-phosphate acyltransferase
MAYAVFKALMTPIVRMLFKVRVEGLENIPASGPVILASNHHSFSDSIFLPMVLRRRVTFVAKAEYFERKRTKWFFSMMGQIPVKRGGGPASERALEAAEEVLRNGGVFGIYPEGTRSPDGRLYKGRTGVARLAMRTGAPICPVAMIGTREAQPIGQVKPNFGSPITIRIGAPMHFERFRNDAAALSDPKAMRQITDEVMFELRELSGQVYINEYPPKKASQHDDPSADQAPATVKTAPGRDREPALVGAR